MGEIEIHQEVEKQVIETVVFSFDVPLEVDEDEDEVSVEITVQVEVTDGKRVYAIATEGNFDVMEHVEAHALYHLLSEAMQWNQEGGSPE